MVSIPIGASSWGADALIAEWQSLKGHPLAAVFPLMKPAALAELKQGIATDGYRPDQPIVLHDGLVLDGRNRLACCVALGVCPPFVAFEGDEAAAARFVLQENLRWRQMDKGARAALVAQLRASVVTAGKAKRAALSARELAAIAQVSATTIARAEYVQERRPDLIKAVTAGEKGLCEALREAGARRVRPLRGGRVSPAAARPAPRPKSPREMELEELEQIIAAEMEPFQRCSDALFQIRERKLYLDNHGEFWRYMHDRWGLAYRRERPLTAGIDVTTVRKEKNHDREQGVGDGDGGGVRGGGPPERA